MAFDDGLIEFEDYRRLLELTRLDYLSADDSIYLTRFPDLLAGFSSSPLIDRTAPPDQPQTASHHDTIKTVNQYHANLLFRQYNRINIDSERKNLYRVTFGRARIQLRGERESFYSGTSRWGPRSISYRLKPGHNHSAEIVAGSYSTSFSMGLIYGYHGQLLSKDSDRDEPEKFLYPIYGGSNGLLVKLPIGNDRAVFLYDADRNASHRQQFTAVSLPATIGNVNLRINGGFGQLHQRSTGLNQDIMLLSIGGKAGSRGRQLEAEVGISEVNNRFPLAGSTRLTYRRAHSYVNLLAWSYASEFPSWFSGGPSSHRYLSVAIDDLDLSLRDRFRGETGGAIKTSQSFSKQITVHAVLGYSQRGLDNNRTEYKIGADYLFDNPYRFRLDCYRRLDNIYSDNNKQTRIQAQFSKNGEVGGRVVAGYRFENWSGRNDYFFLTELRINDRWGRLVVNGKIDRLEPSDLQNRYLYFGLSHDSYLGNNLRGYIKYSYRYLKDSPDTSFGTLRWEMKWGIN